MAGQPWAGVLGTLGTGTGEDIPPAPPTLCAVGLPSSNHSLLSLFEVGRPGAHHLVRVLHSDHEVSARPLLLG